MTVVDLSRNFGHHRAMMAGLSYSKGDLVFLIDCDLEEPPELFSAFYRRLQEERCDVVYGVRKNRRDHPGFELTANAFYWLMARTGGVDLPRNLLTFRLMTRRYVTNLTRHQRDVLIAGLWAITGFKQVPLEITKLPSHHRTNYSIHARAKLTVDYLTAFWSDLLYYIFYCGAGRIPFVLRVADDTHTDEAFWRTLTRRVALALRFYLDVWWTDGSAHWPDRHLRCAHFQQDQRAAVRHRARGYFVRPSALRSNY